MSEKIEKIKQLLRDKKTSDAINEIKELSEEEIQYQDKRGMTLCDRAIEEKDLDAANEIITRYGILKDKTLIPLSIDYPSNDEYPYHVLSNKFMSNTSYEDYKLMIDEQKSSYIKYVESKAEKLFDNAVEMLLKTATTDEQSKIINALKENRSSIELIKLISKDTRNTDGFNKAMALFGVAESMRIKCDEFKKNLISLKQFKTNIKNQVTTHQDLFKEEPGIKETLAMIGNVVASYTGVGRFAAFLAGKDEEYTKGRWKLFSEKTESSQNLEEAKTSVEEIPKYKK